jgi:hypothetical protein
MGLPWVAGAQVAAAAGQAAGTAMQSLGRLTAALVRRDAPHPGDDAHAKLREIVAQYDLPDISPRELSQLVDQLRAADVLSPTELQDLAELRLELDGAGIGPDETVDLVAYLDRTLLAAGDDAANVARQAALLRKLSLLADGHAAEPLDLVA